MKILLVQVPTSHLGARERVYPLGLARLSSLIPSDFKKHALDMNIHADPWPILRKMTINIQPDIVMLSFRNLDPLAGHQTSYLSSLKTAGRMIRALAPKALIWAPVVRRFPCLPNSLWRKLPISIWALKAKVKLCCPGCLPIRLRAMGVEGKRGCDLNCGYCIYPCLEGRSIRLRNPIKIVDEMEVWRSLFACHSEGATRSSLMVEKKISFPMQVENTATEESQVSSRQKNQF
jgi:anaerobic magnesium-protoporphyrin IX monomethyl ester cyclase